MQSYLRIETETVTLEREQPQKRKLSRMELEETQETL